MSFTYSAIGDNTKENREHLEKLGYTVYENPDKKYIHPYTNQYQQSIAIGWGFEDIPKGAIDCRNNPTLFQAVTAIREGSDYMQWFTDGAAWVMFDGRTKYFEKYFHKGTLDELINHFNSK